MCQVNKEFYSSLQEIRVGKFSIKAVEYSYSLSSDWPFGGEHKSYILFYFISFAQKNTENNTSNKNIIYVYTLKSHK